MLWKCWIQWMKVVRINWCYSSTWKSLALIDGSALADVRQIRGNFYRAWKFSLGPSVDGLKRWKWVCG